MDEQTLERAAELQRQVHMQGQDIIGYKRDIERLKGEVVQLKQLVRKALTDAPLELPAEALDISNEELLNEGFDRIGAAPIVQRTETDVPVQNEPLITPVSPPDEPEVLGDPDGIADNEFWRRYYCDVLVTLIKQYPPEVSIGVAEWSDAVATTLTQLAKKHFPQP